MQVRHYLAASVAVSSFALVSAFSGAASAQEESGFEVGGRIGYGVPIGDAFDGTSLSDGVAGQLPLQLDLGYRISPQWFVGGYFSYGIGFEGDDCEDCSISDVRLGAQVTYHFTPITEGNAGWIGGGIGYEWLSTTQDTPIGEASVSLSGFEFLNIQGGYDFQVSDTFRVGPYALLSFAQYSDATIEFAGQEEDGDIDDKTIHEWLMFGVKGTFGAL